MNKFFLSSIIPMYIQFKVIQASKTKANTSKPWSVIGGILKKASYWCCVSRGPGPEEEQGHWQRCGKDWVSHNSYGPQHTVPQDTESNLGDYTHAPWSKL